MNQATIDAANPLTGFYPSANQIAEPPAKIPLDIEVQPEIKPKNRINRDAPRYIVFAGDIMIPSKKRDLRAFQSIHLGGTWFDVGQIPALWRTQGFITRGRITPLLKTAVGMLADSQEIAEKKGDQAVVVGPNGETSLPGARRGAFPYDSLLSLRARMGVKGLVEIEELHTIDYNTGYVQEIQNFVIPGWSQVMAGEQALPFKTSEFEFFIESRKRATGDQLLRAVCDKFLESAQAFRVWGRTVIDYNKLGYDKGVNDAGFRQPITELAEMLAEQLEINIHKNASVVVASSAPSAAPPDPAMLRLEERRIEAMEEQNRLERIRLGIEPAPTTPAPAAVATGAAPTPTATGHESATPAPSDIVIDTPIKCSAEKTRGGQCQNDAIAGTDRCSKHPKTEED